ncbi:MULTISPECIES: thioredoxin domain-containing protein [Lactobacillaceae]|nr:MULTISPECIES: thioredoxin domain-containing protein [Lactobacillaceae]
MKRILIKIVLKAVILIACLIPVSLTGYAVFNHFAQKSEAQQTYVALNDQQNKHKIIFFYRDTCSTCRTIYKLVYMQKLVARNVVMVNLDMPENRTYINQYNLVSVPTLVVGKHQYSGTDVKKIKELFKSAPKLLNQEG